MKNMVRTICILAALLLLFPAVCWGHSNLRRENFIHHTAMKTWKDAQAYCRQHHTDLVTIGGEQENRDFVSGRGWIGLFRDTSASKWKWSRRNETATFLTWDGQDPQDGENCAFKYKDEKKWESDTCSKGHSFMCYDEKLVLVKMKKTWEEALQHCRALEAVDQSKPATAYQNNRYDLATLLTKDDHDYAREKAQVATTDKVWTGLHYLADRWMWVGGGGPVNYSDIESCPTKKFCGTLGKQGTSLFVLRDCKLKFNFFCYRKT